MEDEERGCEEASHRTPPAFSSSLPSPLPYLSLLSSLDRCPYRRCPSFFLVRHSMHPLQCELQPEERASPSSDGDSAGTDPSA